MAQGMRETRSVHCIVFRETSMIRSSIPTVVLFMTLALACNNASDEQKKMNSARAEADEKINTAVRESDQKIRNAQQEEDKKVAEAQASFMKLREDYRHTTTVNLVQLDHKVDDLESKSKQSSGKARAELDANLKQIHADRGVFEADCKSLETATAATWDDAKIRLDKAWTHLKTLVDKA
jgi:hypothetical protein